MPLRAVTFLGHLLDSIHTISEAVPVWCSLMSLAKSLANPMGRSGPHRTIFGVKRDPKLLDKDLLRDKKSKVFPFVTADRYTGHSFRTCCCASYIIWIFITGHWADDQRCGFGAQTTEHTRYEGEFANNLRHGLGTLWSKRKDGNWRKVYTGGWLEGKKEGQGVYLYENGDIYR